MSRLLKFWMWGKTIKNKRAQLERQIAYIEIDAMTKVTQIKPPTPRSKDQAEELLNIVKDIKALLKDENKRDEKRGFFDWYDRNHRHIVMGVLGSGLLALGTIPVLGPTAPLTIALTGFTSGLGLSTFGVRLTYFLHGNKTFQANRRGDDLIDEAQTKLDMNRDISKIESIREHNSLLPRGELTTRQVRNLRKEINQIRDLVIEMNIRDQRVETEPVRKPGRRPVLKREWTTAYEEARDRCLKSGRIDLLNLIKYNLVNRGIAPDNINYDPVNAKETLSKELIPVSQVKIPDVSFNHFYRKFEKSVLSAVESFRPQNEAIIDSPAAHIRRIA